MLRSALFALCCAACGFLTSYGAFHQSDPLLRVVLGAAGVMTLNEAVRHVCACRRGCTPRGRGLDLEDPAS